MEQGLISKLQLSLEESLLRCGLTKLVSVAYSLPQAIVEVLDSYGYYVFTKTVVLRKLESEVNENLQHYQQFLNCETGVQTESSRQKLQNDIHNYVEKGEDGSEIPEELILAALSNAMDLTIVMCQYSEQLQKLDTTISSPSRVEPRHNVHILKSSVSGKTHYHGLHKAESSQFSNSLHKAAEDTKVSDQEIKDALAALDLDFVQDKEEGETEQEIENDMKMFGIKFDANMSLDAIAQSFSEVPNLCVSKTLTYMAYCLRKLNEWESAKINIGVIGVTGTGKSSFVNAIRSVDADDLDGAKVSAVKECTDCIREYKFPQNSNIVIWDLPGVGTDLFPESVYLDEINIDMYDAFVIVSNDRFTNNDKWLANEIALRKKCFYFVRTKIQDDINADIKAHRKTHNAQQLVADIRQETEAHIAWLGLKAQVYLIDNYEPERYDFDKLKGDITANLPKVIQQQAMILSLNAVGDAVIAGKMKELRSQMKMIKFMIKIRRGCITSGYSPDVIFQKIWFIYKQLGLDNESLQIQADILGLPSKEPLLQILKQYISHDVTKEYYRQQMLGHAVKPGRDPDPRNQLYGAIVFPDLDLVNDSLNDFEKAAYALFAYRRELLASSAT